MDQNPLTTMFGPRRTQRPPEYAARLDLPDADQPAASTALARSGVGLEPSWRRAIPRRSSPPRLQVVPSARGETSQATMPAEWLLHIPLESVGERLDLAEIIRGYTSAIGMDEAPPDIVPIVLEGPPLPTPPDAWREIHFNDWLRHVIATEEAVAASRAKQAPSASDPP